MQACHGASQSFQHCKKNIANTPRDPNRHCCRVLKHSGQQGTYFPGGFKVDSLFARAADCFLVASDTRTHADSNYHLHLHLEDHMSVNALMIGHCIQMC